MIVLGSNSDIAQAFVEKILKEGERFEKIYFLTSHPETTEKFARHINVKFFQDAEIIEWDLMKEPDFKKTFRNRKQPRFLRCRIFGRGYRRRPL